MCDDRERFYLPVVPREMGGTRAVLGPQILNRSGDAVEGILHAPESDRERVYLFIHIAKAYLHIGPQSSELVFGREDFFQFRDIRVGNHTESVACPSGGGRVSLGSPGTFVSGIGLPKQAEGWRKSVS